MERKLIEKDFIQTMDHVDTWREELISVEEQRLNDGKEYALDEVVNKMHESRK